MFCVFLFGWELPVSRLVRVEALLSCSPSTSGRRVIRECIGDRLGELPFHSLSSSLPASSTNHDESDDHMTTRRTGQNLKQYQKEQIPLSTDYVDNTAKRGGVSLFDRRSLFSIPWLVTSSLLAISGLVSQPNQVNAAPPIAVIAEELGYFPVRNADGQIAYVPKRIQRNSTDQAIALAQFVRESGAVIYTAYWCPHCARHREVWGRQAWAQLQTVECAPQGYQAQPQLCGIGKGGRRGRKAPEITGFPTWVLGNGQALAGERSLSDLAQAVGFAGDFDESLEVNVPPLLGSSACQ